MSLNLQATCTREKALVAPMVYKRHSRHTQAIGPSILRFDISTTMALRSSNILMCVVVMATTLLWTTLAAGRGRPSVSFECPPEGALVYPYWSTCWRPALYYGQEVYELEAVTGGSLAPEWDESNSTYYMRLADAGAKYLFGNWRTKELRRAVFQSQDLVIVNAETGRALAWRQEGEDEWFLVEVSPMGAAPFQFSTAPNVTLACPMIAGARCEAYHILTLDTWAQLIGFMSSSVQDGATYIKLSSDSSTALPFLLRRTGALPTAAAY